MDREAIALICCGPEMTVLKWSGLPPVPGWGILPAGQRGPLDKTLTLGRCNSLRAEHIRLAGLSASGGAMASALAHGSLPSASSWLGHYEKTTPQATPAGFWCWLRGQDLNL